MLAPSPTSDETIKLFLRSLQETASHLPPSKEEGQAKLAILVERCAADMGLETETIQYLIADVKNSISDKRIRRTRDRWNKRFARLPGTFSDRPRVVMLIPDGQSIRSFLLTDVCKKICTWAHLFILSPLDIKADVAALGPTAFFLPIPNIRRNRFDTLVGYLGYRQTGSPTNLRFVQRLDEQLQKAQESNAPLENTLQIWKIAQGLLSDADYLKAYCWSLRFFAHTHSLKEFTELLRRLQPDLVLNTSCVPWPSRLWTRAGAVSGIPVVSNVISWDNMSTKTLLDEFADTYLIWSEEMDEDFATTVPFLRNARRVIVGSPQFEPIVQGHGLVPRAEFLTRHGLDPSKKLILYTTGSKTLFPREAECLDTVLGHWREHWRDHANIMVRMHPKDREGRYEAVRKKFPEVPFTLAGHNLAFDEDWVPNQDDIALLVNQIHHCDVIVNVASTMTIEGFSIDKPSVNIGFTLGPSINARYPMEDYYKSRHYCDVVDTGAARWVADYSELYAAVDDVLDRKLYDVEKQRRLLRMKCLYTKDASDRINQFLADYAARHRSSMSLAVKRLRWLITLISERLRAWQSKRSAS